MCILFCAAGNLFMYVWTEKVIGRLCLCVYALRACLRACSDFQPRWSCTHTHAALQHPQELTGGRVQMQTNGLVERPARLLETLQSDEQQHQQHADNNKQSDTCLDSRVMYSTSTLTRGWSYDYNSLLWIWEMSLVNVNTQREGSLLCLISSTS